MRTLRHSPCELIPLKRRTSTMRPTNNSRMTKVTGTKSTTATVSSSSGSRSCRTSNVAIKLERHAPHGSGQRFGTPSGSRSALLNLQEHEGSYRCLVIEAACSTWNRPTSPNANWKLHRFAQPATPLPSATSLGNRNVSANMEAAREWKPFPPLATPSPMQRHRRRDV